MIKNVYVSCTLSSSYSCQTLRKLELSGQIFEKYTNINFNENPSSVSRVVPRGRTDEQTNMTKLIVAFLILANALKNGEHLSTLTETFVMFFSELSQHALERVMNHETL
jgi:hypothetical protein